MEKILVIHGPNLNLLGRRCPEVYGRTTLREIDRAIQDFAREEGVEVQTFQSNHEGAIIETIHKTMDWANGIVINGGAFTHYSYAVRDALEAAALPCVEVHLTNIYGREEFRHRSVISPIALGVVCGFGPESYILGLKGLIGFLRRII